MDKRYLLIAGGLSLALALSACDSPNDLIENGPTLTFNSRAQPNEIRDCLTEDHLGAVNVTPIKGGWAIIQQIVGIYGPEDTAWVIRVTSATSGSHVEVYEKSLYYASYKNAAGPCVQKFRSG